MVSSGVQNTSLDVLPDNAKIPQRKLNVMTCPSSWGTAKLLLTENIAAQRGRETSTSRAESGVRALTERLEAT